MISALLQLIYGSTLDFAGIPDDFHVLYAAITSIAIFISAFVAWKYPSQVMYFVAIAAIMVGAIGLTLIRQTLIVEYLSQPQAQVHEPTRKNLVVPIPFPGLRSASFEPYAPPTGPLFSRTPGATMRQIVLRPENLGGIWLTITLHMAAVISLVFGAVFSSVVLAVRCIKYVLR